MKVVILAGGKGTRLAPYTVVFPKPLMPLEDIPILEVVIRQLRYYGFSEIFLAVGHLSELIRSYFNNGHRFGLNIHYSIERDPLGTAGPLTLITDLDEPFLVMNGDILTDMDYRVLCQYHIVSKAAATIATHKRVVKIDLGVVTSSNENRIVDYTEKPTFDYLVSMGIYVFDPSVMKYIEPEQRLDFPELVLRLIKAGELVLSYPYEGYWLDIGRPDDYAQAIEEFSNMRSRFLPGE
jgi:NDP-sugar pyrophosphorylase family protein